MSLRLKMTVGIGAILLIVILAYTITASVQQQRYLQHLAKHEADLIAQIAGRGLTRAMERGETDVVEAILRRMGEHPVLTRIRIVDSQGKILRSNRSNEIGQTLPPGERPAEGNTSEPFWDTRERTVSVFRPIANGPVCTNCHSSNRPILGFLNVVSSFPPLESDFAQHWMLMVLTAVFSLVATGALIGVFFTLALGRRIDMLSRTMSRVEAGDLTARVQAGGPDELGRLARSFNRMVARLDDARRQLEDRHLGAIRRAEHLASLGK
ncbi:MAG TPA: HAMP domain-containing protein, partial [Syntrophobacteria bacterium]|nr:HAMP domain-containing protein [Syntrophobacteria bacterium]